MLCFGMMLVLLAVAVAVAARQMCVFPEWNDEDM